MILNSQCRPADVFLPSWKGGRPAALDVTVVSTMQQATIQGAASTQGHALMVGQARKLAAHGDACQAVGVFFIPLVLETLGGMSASAVNTLACLGHCDFKTAIHPCSQAIMMEPSQWEADLELVILATYF